MEIMAKTIARLRRERGMTQEALAERIGVSPQTVSKWETQATCPDVALLPVLADVFGVSLDYLVGRTNVETSPEVEEAVISAEEMQLTAAYRMLNERQRRAVRELLKSF